MKIKNDEKQNVLLHLKSFQENK